MQRELKHVLVVVAFAIAAGGQALAADMAPAPEAYFKAPIVPVYNWTGIYLGVNGGYTFGQQTPGSLFGDAFTAFNYNANGGLVGGTVGAQIQSGHTLLGLEADIDWARINSSGRGTVSFNGSPIGTATLSSSLSSISTLRTRVGYAVDNWLFFVTGGLAVTNETSNLTGPVGFFAELVQQTVRLAPRRPIFISAWRLAAASNTASRKI